MGRFRLGDTEGALADVTTGLDPEACDFSSLAFIPSYQPSARSDSGLYRELLKIADELVERTKGAVGAYAGRAKLHALYQQYAKALEDYDTATEQSSRAEFPIRDHSDLKNEAAWFLANCPNTAFRNPARARQLAQAAVDRHPEQSHHWRTLGAAHYRAGDWKAALSALKTCMKLRREGDGVAWFFAAMAHWKLADKEQARQWFDQAVAWMEKEQPQNDELRRYRTEAEILLWGEPDDSDRK